MLQKRLEFWTFTNHGALKHCVLVPNSFLFIVAKLLVPPMSFFHFPSRQASSLHQKLHPHAPVCLLHVASRQHLCEGQSRPLQCRAAGLWLRAAGQPEDSEHGATGQVSVCKYLLCFNSGCRLCECLLCFVFKGTSVGWFVFWSLMDLTSLNR